MSELDLISPLRNMRGMACVWGGAGKKVGKERGRGRGLKSRGKKNKKTGRKGEGDRNPHPTMPME